ncbi:mechanosensitive ion channel family protein [Gallaecimonas pentaromativorans]|uniref:mechanosensitive ion channel family protein n=1 Tax=Gallaecimonas pentaromativorans TaxID=584787 RepID=UPI001FCFF7C0|nr:mechanosensitive ion channel domain-containing protein [Gallaecimonas pentaromativorans]
MDFAALNKMLAEVGNKVVENLLMTSTYAQLALVLVIFALSFFLARRLRKLLPLFAELPAGEAASGPLRRLTAKLGNLFFPLLAILALSIFVTVSQQWLGHSWLVRAALLLAMLLVFNALIRDHVRSDFIAFVFRWIGLPLIFLHLIDALAPLIDILDAIAVKVGNIEVSAYGVVRVVLFGSLLFWLGRVSTSTGQEIIRRQEKLDFRTREVAAKLLQVAIFLLIFLMLLQVMGINLTALAVFGGALGVGLGFGLQAIASNFISGIIILLDRSISVNDYIELADGRTGIVRELTLRSTTLETFDGKDIMVPNEKFMTESFTNWTHKNKKQRYRVDFSVAYRSDIRKLVEIVKVVVASHPKVLSGEELPIEERPDCEIDSFGDSGINMFVEFWMYGIDDGKNRVGGDLLLMILEALQEHGFEIPFPQREVRVLNEGFGKS